MDKFKKIITLLLVCALLTPCFAFADEEEKPLFSFTAVTDLHLDELLFQTLNPNVLQFKQILNDSKEHRDLFISGGDISSYGNELVWLYAKHVVEKTNFENELWILGNHEYGITGLNPFTQEKYKKFSGNDSIFFTREIKGYQFICLGVEEGIPFTLGSYSDEQIAWFKDALADAVDASKTSEGPNKPIFVIGHYGPITKGNVDSAISPIIEEQAKEGATIIYLWGHEHGFEFWGYDMNNLIFQEEQGGGAFEVAKMGSTHYYLSPNADALYVDVFPDKVVLNLHRTSGFELEGNPIVINLAL